MKDKPVNNYYGITPSANVRWTFEKLEPKGKQEARSVVKYCYTIRFENSVWRNQDLPNKLEE